MKPKNKYIWRSKISEAKFRRIIRFFSHDLDAQTIAHLVHLNRNTVNRYFLLIRKRLAEICQQEFAVRSDEVFISAKEAEQPAHYYNSVKYEKSQLFGLTRNGDCVFTQLVPIQFRPRLQGLFRRRSTTADILQAKQYCKCHSIVHVGKKRLLRLNDPVSCANEKNKIDIIEAFWSFAKQRLSKFHGLAGSTFYLHVKECEFRFNRRNDDLYKVILEILRHDPLS